jgi:hypothetical protein
MSVYKHSEKRHKKGICSIRHSYVAHPTIQTQLREYRLGDDNPLGIAYLSNAHEYRPHSNNNVIPARFGVSSQEALSNRKPRNLLENRSNRQATRVRNVSDLGSHSTLASQNVRFVNHPNSTLEPSRIAGGSTARSLDL